MMESFPLVARYRILGPLVAVGKGGKVVPLRAKPRALLATLLLSPGAAVSVERIADAIWGEGAPASARELVRLYVSQLRETLGGDAIETCAGGYTVRTDNSTDAAEFAAAGETARTARAAGETERALAAFDRALALWRGPVLVDTPLEGEARIQAHQLEESRLAALNERFELALTARGAHELVAELESLVVAFPTRERLRGLLMLALYRSGRQADALAVYRDGRQHLANEYGLEPGAELRELERAILQQDPSLDLPRSTPVQPTTTGRRGRRVLLALVALAAGATVIAAVWAQNDHGPVRVPTDSLVALDPRTGRSTNAIAISGSPIAMAVGAGLVYVGTGSRTLAEVDPRNHRIVRTIGLPKLPHAVAYAGGHIWVGNEEDGTLTRIGPGGLVSPPERPEPHAEGRLSLARDADELWVGSVDNVATLLTAEGGARMSTRVIQPQAMTVAFGSLWVAQATRVTVRRINTRTGRTVSLIPVGAPTKGVVAGASSIWVLSWTGSTLWRIDPQSDAVTAAIPVGPDASAVAAAGSSVWVVSAASGTLEQIDPSRNRVARTIRLGHLIGAVAASENALWLGVR
jgi:DNA-binding SARP family transcriptional activator